MWWEWLIVIAIGGTFNGYLVWKMIEDNRKHKDE